MKLNALDTCIINRKKMIKRLNAVRKERTKLQADLKIASEVESHSIDSYIKILNARISEMWGFYNDLIKTQKLLEDSGMTPTIQ